MNIARVAAGNSACTDATSAFRRIVRLRMPCAGQAAEVPGGAGNAIGVEDTGADAVEVLATLGVSELGRSTTIRSAKLY
jgi:hypothetical protein